MSYFTRSIFTLIVTGVTGRSLAPVGTLPILRTTSTGRGPSLGVPAMNEPVTTTSLTSAGAVVSLLVDAAAALSARRRNIPCKWCR